jgi:hypothetical protein
LRGAQLAHAVGHVGLIGRCEELAAAGKSRRREDYHGDLDEIEDRKYDVVSNKHGGVTLEPAITKTVAQLHAEHGTRPLAPEEFEQFSGALPSDGEG